MSLPVSHADREALEGLGPGRPEHVVLDEAPVTDRVSLRDHPVPGLHFEKPDRGLGIDRRRYPGQLHGVLGRLEIDAKGIDVRPELLDGHYAFLYSVIDVEFFF